ncbi:hypothetical protein [Halobaculum sp. P14]|uniref:hypothetical protein n=1 Tax=Halobaculum sp. P14 TaxID=3421638 RepID=UPI003EC01F8E
MATNGPAHGNGAQTSEFTVDLVGHGVDRPDAPDQVTVEASVDANHTFQLDINTPSDHGDWRLDVHVVRGRVKPQRAFQGRVPVVIDALPDWMDVVTEQTETRLLRGH